MHMIPMHTVETTALLVYDLILKNRVLKEVEYHAKFAPGNDPILTHRELSGVDVFPAVQCCNF